MLDNVSLITTQTYDQPTFHRQRAQRGKFISRNFFYTEIKGRPNLEFERKRLILNREVKVITEIERFSIEC